MKEHPGCLSTITASFNKFEELDTEKEMECYYKYINEGNEDAKKMLVESTTKKLMRYVFYLYQGVPDDTMCDLLMEMSVGVLEALAHYDPQNSNGAKFSTYAQWRARKRLSDYMLKDCVVRKPQRAFRRAGKIMNVEQEFCVEHGRYPNYEEIAQRTGLTVQQVKYVKEKTLYVRAQALSLDYGIGEDEDTSLMSILDLDADAADLEELIVEQETDKEIVDRVTRLIEKLPKRKKEILRMRYGMDDGHFKTGSECGAILGTSRQYVSATEVDAINRIRKYGADELAELREMTH